MKIIETKVYPFDELSEDVKQKVLERYCQINTDNGYEWWKGVYEDAKRIGLKIQGFDIDRGNYCKGKFINSPKDSAELIIKEHGESCETYKTAKHFLAELNELTGKTDNIEDVEESDIERIEDNFIESLCEDYRIILQKEFEYLTSKEAIIETFEANEYTFTEDGKMFN